MFSPEFSIGWPFFASALIILELIIQTWTRPQTRTSAYFMGILFGGFMWSVSTGMLHISESLVLKRCWLVILYLIKAVLSTVWLLMALDFTESKYSRNRRVTAGLLIIPAITAILVLTNPYHHLFFNSISLNPESHLIQLEWGVWVPVHLIYSYAVMGLGILYFIASAVRNEGILRRQSLIMGLAAVFPIMTNLAYYLNGGTSTIEYTPIAFSISCVIFSVGLFHFKLLEFRPIAREEIVQMLHDGIVVTDTEGYVIDVNPAAVRLLDLSARAPAGQPIRKIMPDLACDFAADGSGEIQECELEQDVDGETRYFDVQMKYVRGEDSRLSGYLFTIKDTTGRKKAEKAVMRARDEAEEVSNMKTAFITNMSHEIRTPLSGIIGFSTVLEEEVDEQHREFVTMIRDAAGRLLKMLNSILQISELQSGAIAMNPSRFELGELIERTCSRVSDEAARKGLTLRTVVPKKPVFVRLDPDHVANLLFQLVDNAVKYTDEGSVLVKASVAEDAVALTVKDTGRGMDNRFQRRMRDAFERAYDGLDRDTDGAGLGLAVVCGILNVMDGRLHVESDEGIGSTFSVVIPEAGSGSVVDRCGDDAPKRMVGRRGSSRILEDVGL